MPLKISISTIVRTITVTANSYMCYAAAALVLAIGNAVALPSATEDDGQYDVTIVKADGGDDLFLTDINNHGVAVGYIRYRQTTAQGRQRDTVAVRYQDGELTLLETLVPPPDDTEHVYLDTLPDRSSKALAVNDHGVMVGWATTPEGNTRAVRWSTDGAVTDLGTFGGPNSSALDINNHNCIVGWAEAEVERSYGRGIVHRKQASAWYRGEMYRLGDAEVSEAHAINDSFLIGGISSQAGHPRLRGFLLHGLHGDMLPIKVIKGDRERDDRPALSVRAISADGTVIGEIHGRLRIPGNLVLYICNPEGQCQTPGGSSATDVNSHGHLLGDHGLLWRPGHARVHISELSPKLQPRHRYSPRAAAINDRGQIVGTVGSRRHAGLILSPNEMTEPPTVPPPPETPEQKDQEPRNLIFITHGWATNAEEWAADLARIFEEQLELRQIQDDWIVKVGDWGEVSGAGRIRIGTKTIGFDWPWSHAEFGAQAAAEIARIKGKDWAKQIKLNMGTPKLVHLIGHSAGSHAIEVMSAELEDGDTYIQMTFLDAFVPKNWDKGELFGKHANFAEHYRDTRTFAEWFADLVSGAAGPELVGCWNLDVAAFSSDATLMVLPDMWTISFNPRVVWSHYHAWPHEWYRQSLGSGYGLDISPALGEPPSHIDSGFERHVSH